MQISNELEIQSFQFTTDKPNMLVRAEEIDNLAEIDAKDVGKGEKVLVGRIGSHPY